MSAKVPNIVSSQSATTQTTSLTLSFTPTVSGIYRLNAYAVIDFTSGNANLTFGWTDSRRSWTWGPNSGPGVGSLFAQPMSAEVFCVSGQPIELIYAVTSGTPSADLYFTVEDMN